MRRARPTLCNAARKDRSTTGALTWRYSPSPAPAASLSVSLVHIIVCLPPAGKPGNRWTVGQYFFCTRTAHESPSLEVATVAPQKHL
jgi:hypothetical protein